MAEEKKKASKPKKRSAKNGIQFYTDDATATALQQYLDDRPKDERPTKRAVLEAALEMYLTAKGYWPPGKR